MKFAIDFDGTIVKQDHDYDDLESPLEFIPGAKEALLALRKADHLLLLWSARASYQNRKDPTLDPFFKAGVARIDPKRAHKDVQLGEARYQQMLAFVAATLPGMFDAIDDGSFSKPSVDLFIDDKTFPLVGPGSWAELVERFG